MKTNSLWSESWMDALPSIPADAQVIEVADLQLSPAVVQALDACYRPLAAYINQRLQGHATPFILGINGAQGTGKSTAAAFLGQLLHKLYARDVCCLSIDDFYLTRSQRSQLAEQVHPLLQTRGVPGTHDLPLALGLMDALRSAWPQTRTEVVRFDKARDDRCTPDLYEQFVGRPHVIILEGWCVGAVPQVAADLNEACNSLERERDMDGRWRSYVNDQLAIYQSLFAQLDMLVMLQAPSFEQVYEWRELQEQKLRARLRPDELAGSRVMSPEQVRHFISHYERLTRWMLSEMPDRADVVLALDSDHSIAQIKTHPALT